MNRRFFVALGVAVVAIVGALVVAERRQEVVAVKRVEPLAPAVSAAPEVAAVPERIAIENESMRGVPPLEAPSIAERSQQAIAASPLPVRVFDDFGPEDLVTTGGEWYAISSTRGDLHRTLHAARIEAGGAGAEAETSLAERAETHVNGHPASTALIHGIVTVSWIEDGVSYALDVECGVDPLTHPTCQGPDYALRLARSVVSVSRQ